MEIESAQSDRSTGWARWDTQDAVNIPAFDLHTAASVGHEESVKQLISRPNIKVDVDKKNKGGWTPLMYAAYYDYSNIITLLLRHGANVNLRNFVGQSPLMLASMCGNEKCIRTLLQEKANIEDRDVHGYSALFHAANSGHPNIVDLLLQWGADPNVTEKKNKMTPLIVAVTGRHEAIVRSLLQHGADITAMNVKGESPRSIALSLRCENILNLLDLYNKPKANVERKLQDGPLAVASLLERHHIKSPVIPLPAQHLFNSPAILSDALQQQRSQNLTQPTNLQSLLEGLGLSSYYKLFEEQDVDLQVFLTLGDAELKEVGVNLLGPRRKMTAAINRWHQRAPMLTNPSEVAFANRLMAEKDEMRAVVEQTQSLLLKEQQNSANAEKNLIEEKSKHLDCLSLLMKHTSQLMNLMQKLKRASASVTVQGGEISANMSVDDIVSNKDDSVADVFQYMDGVMDKMMLQVTLILNTIEEGKASCFTKQHF